MSKLQWNRPQDRTVELGLDRGVIYVEDGPVVAWSGLTSVEDSGESKVQEFFIDGIKYLGMVSPRDWKGSLSAYTYPDEFSELIGQAEMSDGFYVDSQPSQRFNLSYRTMVSTPDVDKKQHYKIHLISKVMASLSSFTNETLSEDINPSAFDFDLSAIPLPVPGRRPTAHFILDTRKIDEGILSNLENIIYGTEEDEPRFPTIQELLDLTLFSGGVTVVDNGNGTWTATGSNSKIKMLDEKGHFQIDEIAATDLPNGRYQLTEVED